MRFDSLSSASRCGRNVRWRAFTILEVMLAATILVLVLAGSITTLQRGFMAIDTARNYTHASQVLQSEMERLRLYDWTQLQSLQDAGETTFATASLQATATASFKCTRAIHDLKTDMKEITLTATWNGHDGRAHRARFVTRYSKSGLYDYFYTAH